jgi:hypothetical protein
MPDTPLREHVLERERLDAETQPAEGIDSQ